MLKTEEIRAALAALYAEQIAAAPSDYLRYHASPQAVASRVDSFMNYREFLPASGRILDWGCHHAPDSAMVRMNASASEVSITGCDFVAPDSFPVFWGYSGLDYAKLEHIVKLPFENGSFDCIIAGAALEHTAHDYESLKELYRVLKTGGRLIVTHLPNRFSYVEFAARNFRKSGFHRRLYSVSEFSMLLGRTGFYPLTIKRHRILPSQYLKPLTKAFSCYEPSIERIWPINLFCSDILAVAEKVDSM